MGGGWGEGVRGWVSVRDEGMELGKEMRKGGGRR